MGLLACLVLFEVLETFWEMCVANILVLHNFTHYAGRAWRYCFADEHT